MRLVRPLQKRLSAIPGIGLAMVLPNTAAFVAETRTRSRSDRGAPTPPLSLGLVAQVAVDETLIGIARTPKRFPHRADYTRVGEELRAARALYESRGWIDQPRTYHRTPAMPAVNRRRTGSARKVAYEHVEWVSGYEPHPGEPAGDRWQGFEANRQAHAWLVRAPRPTTTWLVCIHGLGMGMPLTDLHIFRARELAGQLGLNLAFPILPLHGPRKQSRVSGTEFISFDLLHPVFALSQAVWDSRALMSWLQAAEGAERFGLYGLSFGAHTAGVLAGVDDRFEMIIAGIPATDFPALFRHHSPPALRARAEEHGMLGDNATLVHRVVSPLAFEPQVPPSRRYVYGALGDRIAKPEQAQQLWEHWCGPSMEWLEGGHVVAVISPTAGRFVTRSLTDSGLLVDPSGPLRTAAPASA